MRNSMSRRFSFGATISDFEIFIDDVPYLRISILTAFSLAFHGTTKNLSAPQLWFASTANGVWKDSPMATILNGVTGFTPTQ